MSANHGSISCVVRIFRIAPMVTLFLSGEIVAGVDSHASMWRLDKERSKHILRGVEADLARIRDELLSARKPNYADLYQRCITCRSLIVEPLTSVITSHGRALIPGTVGQRSSTANLLVTWASGLLHQTDAIESAIRCFATESVAIDRRAVATTVSAEVAEFLKGFEPLTRWPILEPHRHVLEQFWYAERRLEADSTIVSQFIVRNGIQELVQEEFKIALGAGAHLYKSPSTVGRGNHHWIVFDDPDYDAVSITPAEYSIVKVIAGREGEVFLYEDVETIERTGPWSAWKFSTDSFRNHVGSFRRKMAGTPLEDALDVEFGDGIAWSPQQKEVTSQ